jgi:predicted NBD/HSP70 family sugar kinase
VRPVHDVPPQSSYASGPRPGPPRQTNLGVVLRHLRSHGPRSRARLASDLDLTRSAVSSLVAELEGRGLVREGDREPSGPGRPGTRVELDGRGVCGIGAEINVNHVATLALDLAGAVVAEHRRSLDAHLLGARAVVDQLGELVDLAVTEVRASGARPVGLTVGVAGLVDRSRAVLTHGPNLGWRDIPVGALVRERLSPDYPVQLDNEGNLAAIAEAVPGDPARQDLLVLFGEVGVGGGIVAGGQLLRGHQGYAGELGHMIVDPGGRRCGCGRVGCWETVTGLRALMESAADPDDPICDPALGLEPRLAEINRRAELGDPRTLAALDQVGGWVGTGAAILANVLNPAAVVLGGYFAQVGRHLLPTIESRLDAEVLAPHAGGTRVQLSTLGFSAATRGAATLALDCVFADPTTVGHRVPTVAGGVG